MPYRVVLIGAGIISRNHLNAIRQMKELSAAAVADIDEERGRTVSGEYGITYYSDYKEMVRKEKPDIAIIALPHFLHEECAIWCAAQGCHLLLEKPMALNVKQCDAILGQQGLRASSSWSVIPSITGQPICWPRRSLRAVSLASFSPFRIPAICIISVSTAQLGFWIKPKQAAGFS